MAVGKNSVKPGTPRPNRIAYKQLYIYKRITGNLSKILVPSEVHVDAALNKDNLLHPHKILQINKLHRYNQN